MPRGIPKVKAALDADGMEMPTAADVARWKSALLRVEGQIKGLSAKAEQLTTLIAAAAPLVSVTPAPPPKLPKSARIKPVAKKVAKRKKAKKVVAVAPELPLHRGRDAKDGTWTSIIHSILTEAGRGLVHSELRAEVAKTELADRLNKSDKGFYGGIAKLAEKEPPLLIKYKGRLFAPETHQKFMADVAAGRVPDLEEIPHIGNASPFRDAILDVMKSGFKNGATSTEIIETLKKNPALLSTVQRHPTHTYNVLKRMIDHGELTKWGDRYFLGPKLKAA